jgi:transposase
LTPGGDGKTLTDIQISAIRTLWEQGKSIKEISEELKLSHSTVYHRVCKYTDFNIRENQKRAKKD